MDVVYRFSGFSVDPVRRLLFGPDGKPVALKPRVFDTLLHLIEHRGQLLEKQALLDAVWPHVVVEENNLNQAISTLRRVFGETRDDHRFIVTEPGRGYRFVARVEVARVDPGDSGTATSSESPKPSAPENVAAGISAAALSDAGPHAGSEPAAPRAERGGHRPRSMLGVTVAALVLAAVFVGVGVYFSQDGAPTPSSTPATQPMNPSQSVAVLPFADLSEGGDRMWLADGLTEEILNSLARLPELKVTARTSSFQFRNEQRDIGQIAARLGVAHVLEGSVRLVDDRLRVTAQLIRASDGFHVWSEAYDGTTSDLLDFQRDVAERVAAALDVVLDEGRRASMFASGTRNVEAFEAYLQGVAIAGNAVSTPPTRNIGDSLPYFERALTLDPHYALAALGETHTFILTLLLGPAESPYSQDEALVLLLQNLDLVVLHSTTPTMRLVSEIIREGFSPTWHRMPGLLSRLSEELDPNSLMLGDRVDGVSGLARVLGTTGHHDLMRAIAQRHVTNDPLAIQAWLRSANVEINSGHFGRARDVIAEARRVIGLAPAFALLEFKMARLEGRRDQAIAYLSGRGDPGAAMLLAAVEGDYETALRMADEYQESVQGPATLRLDLLLHTYHEIDAAERLKSVVKRIDDSPAGTVIFMQILGVSGALLFDLDDAPNFAAKLGQAGIDLASVMPRMPRFSAAE